MAWADSVVAVPAAVSTRIVYDPPLPVDRALLMRRMPLGTIYKIAVLYDAPWWRDDGLSGQSLDLDSPLPLTLDGCGATSPPGILNLFGSGPSARHLSHLATDERRRIAIAALMSRFGARAAGAIDYVEQDWAEEEWTRGCFMAHYGPGVLTRLGHLLREPVGRVHWAGTETSPVMNGFIDGAVRSGERAAEEVLAAGSGAASLAASS